MGHLMMFKIKHINSHLVCGTTRKLWVWNLIRFKSKESLATSILYCIILFYHIISTASWVREPCQPSKIIISMCDAHLNYWRSQNLYHFVFWYCLSWKHFLYSLSYHGYMITFCLYSLHTAFLFTPIWK